MIAGADDGIRVIALGLAGRRDEARRRLIEMRQSSRIPTFQSWIDYLTAWLDRRPADMAVRISALTALKIQDDPEAIFQEGWLLCDVGEHQQGLDYLQPRGREGLFRRADARECPAFRRAARRSRRSALSSIGGSRPTAGTRGIPRGGRGAAHRNGVSG